MMYQDIYNCICQKNKKNKDILSIMLNLQPNCCLKIDFQKVDQHAGGIFQHTDGPQTWCIVNEYFISNRYIERLGSDTGVPLSQFPNALYENSKQGSNGSLFTLFEQYVLSTATP